MTPDKTTELKSGGWRWPLGRGGRDSMKLATAITLTKVPITLAKVQGAEWTLTILGREDDDAIEISDQDAEEGVTWLRKDLPALIAALQALLPRPSITDGRE